MPVVFCAVGYLILWLALQPVWGLIVSTAGLLVSDSAPNFDSTLSQTYDPNAKKAEGDVIDARTFEFPLSGEQYGHLSCERIGLDAPVYWYDDDEILNFGAGQSLNSLLPGYGTGIVLSGHNNTFFAPLEHIQEGDVVSFKTNYCDYEYTVNRVEVMDEKVLEGVIHEYCGPDVNREQLIMYTCYPFYAIAGRKTDRLVVFADRTAGKDVKWRDFDES